MCIRSVNIIKAKGGDSRLSQIVRYNKITVRTVIVIVTIGMVYSFKWTDDRPDWALEIPLNKSEPSVYS